MESKFSEDEEDEFPFPLPSILISMSNSSRFISNSNRIPDIYSFVDNYIQSHIDRLILEEVSNESLQSYQNDILKKNEQITITNEKHVTYNDSESRNKKCFICMEDFNSEESLLQLKCLHNYHTNCIREAVKYNNKCPICKDIIECNQMRSDAVSESL
jgi:hypothetical protein